MSAEYLYKYSLLLYDPFMATIGSSRARESFPDVIERAKTEAVTIERHQRAVAVVISPERHAELLEAWEEMNDIAAFDEALAEEADNIPWDQVKADLGWQ